MEITLFSVFKRSALIFLALELEFEAWQECLFCGIYFMHEHWQTLGQ